MITNDELLIKLSALHNLALLEHYYCEDCWYSCPKAEGGCANDAHADDECTCGADEHNSEVNKIFTEIMTTIKES